MVFPRSLAKSTVLGAACLVGLALTFCAGKRAGRADASNAQLHAVLDTNAHKLAQAKARADTTHRAAVGLTAAADSHRVVTRAVQRQIQIVDSSTVRLAVADSIATAAIPPLVVTELEDDRVQMHQDTLAIGALVADGAAKDSVIARLDERTQLLDQAVKSEAHAAFWRGAKMGAAVAVVTYIVAHFLR